MYMYTQGHSRLISTGAHLPENRVTSREIMEEIDSKGRFDVPYNWLERTTGVKERRMAPDDVLPSELAAIAAQQAIERAGIDASEIDAIIYAGITRDYLEPATAHVVQHKIKAYNALAFDVTNACHGFMNGIHVMDLLISTGQARRGLVVTGERATRYTKIAIDLLKSTTSRESFLKHASGLALGDAGAAVVMGPKIDPDAGFVGFMLQSQGQYYNMSICGRNGEPTPLEAEMVPLINEGVRLTREMYSSFMDKVKWRPEDIAHCVQHQASRNMLKHATAYMGVTPDIVVDSVSMHGNLATANVPINLDMLFQAQVLAKGQKILVTGGGSGISLSNAGLIWDAA